MESVFIIFSQNGDWESSPEAFGFVFTKEEAETTISKLKDRLKQANDWQDKLSAKTREFTSKTPPPVMKDLRVTKKWPAGIAKKDITLEMQKERDNDKAYNQMIMDKNSLQHKEYKKQTLNYIKELFDSIPAEIKNMFDEENFYMNCHLDKNNPYFYEEIQKIVI